MKNNKAEETVAEFFQYQEDCFVMPDEKQIKAFKTVPEKSKIENRRVRKIRYVPIIAACLAIIVSIVSVVAVLKLNDNDVTIPDIEYFGEVKKVDGVANWYEPGELDIKTVLLEKSSNSLMNASGFIKPISYKTVSAQNKVLPDWVIGVTMDNERYATLHYEFLPEGYNHGYIVYDLQRNKITTLGEKIYDFVGDFLEARNINDRSLGELIQIEKFDTNPEWCIFRTWNDTVEPNIYERYLVNIETGELYLLPTSDIIAISSDYKQFVFCRDDRLDNGELIERVISYYDVKTKEEKNIITTQKGDDLSMHHAQFSDDDRYIISYIYNGENGGWDTVDARWIIYDIQTGKTNNGNGKIIRYTENDDAVIVKDREGAKIYRLSDMADVTNDYKLAIHEHYEIMTTESSNKTIAVYMNPILGNGDAVLVADNVDLWLEWNDYLYIHQQDAKQILVYSIKNNEYFTCEFHDEIKKGIGYSSSMFIADSGKSCHIATYFNEGELEGGTFDEN